MDLQLIMARYTCIINCRPCCNLYIRCNAEADDSVGLRVNKSSSADLAPSSCSNDAPAPILFVVICQTP